MGLRQKKKICIALCFHLSKFRQRREADCTSLGASSQLSHSPPTGAIHSAIADRPAGHGPRNHYRRGRREGPLGHGVVVLHAAARAVDGAARAAAARRRPDRSSRRGSLPVPSRPWPPPSPRSSVQWMVWGWSLEGGTSGGGGPSTEMGAGVAGLGDGHRRRRPQFFQQDPRSRNKHKTP
jgi:hypothetical protein